MIGLIAGRDRGSSGRRPMPARFATAFGLAACLAGPPSLAGVTYHHDIDNPRCCLFIAHAGGGIDGNPYTNSEEAVLANLKAGVRVFEVDFSPTRDGVWVGTHDWHTWKKQTAYAGSQPPSYAEFTSSRLNAAGPTAIDGRYSAITIPFLETLLTKYPKMVIVTDTKYDLMRMARALKDTKLFKRLVPQAYSIEDVESLAGLGFRKIILTIYKMDVNDPGLLVRRIAAMPNKPHALTVPMRFFSEHHKLLAGIGIPVYAHGAPAHINSMSLHDRFRRQGIAGFYLD
ncbi:MAG: hypothetical protein ROZ00_01090 [Denitratisoma sp.]|nr:hypothetical protein [Denitratisoma sp.]